MTDYLITELKKDLKSVEEFLINPMLVSLLFKSFTHKALIPLEKSAFYSQVYDALFEDHDQTKPLYYRDKKSKLSRDRFEQALRSLGIITLQKGVGYTKNEILNHIDHVRRMCSNLDFESSSFLNDLLLSVPLFASEGNYYRWKHKSLQEYFAARYVCVDAKENQVPMLRKMVEEEKYSNVLNLCLSLDPITFRNTIVYDHITKFLHFYDNSYLSVDRDLISEESIKLRKQLCFGHDFIIFRSEPIDFTEHFKSIFRRAMKGEYENKEVADVFVKSEMGIFDDNNGRTYVSWNIKPFLMNIVAGEKGIVQQIPNVSGLLTQECIDEICNEELLLISDDPANPCNESSRFMVINDAIACLLQGSNILDPDSCRQLKLSIESDIEQNKNTNAMLNLI